MSWRLNGRTLSQPQRTCEVLNGKLGSLLKCLLCHMVTNEPPIGKFLSRDVALALGNLERCKLPEVFAQTVNINHTVVMVS